MAFSIALDGDNLLFLLFLNGKQALSFKGIRRIGRIDRVKARDPEHVPVALACIFRKLPGNHCRVSFYIDLAVVAANDRVVKEWVGTGGVGFNDIQPVMVSNPFAGKQYLLMQHPCLLFCLPVDKIVLDTGGIIQKKAVRTEENGADGNNKFSLQLQNGILDQELLIVADLD